MNACLKDPDESEWSALDEEAELRSEYPPEPRRHMTWQESAAEEYGIPLGRPL